jgi:hypothetical protein
MARLELIADVDAVALADPPLLAGHFGGDHLAVCLVRAGRVTLPA